MTALTELTATEGVTGVGTAFAAESDGVRLREEDGNVIPIDGNAIWICEGALEFKLPVVPTGDGFIEIDWARALYTPIPGAVWIRRIEINEAIKRQNMERGKLVMGHSSP